MQMLLAVVLALVVGIAVPASSFHPLRDAAPSYAAPNTADQRLILNDYLPHSAEQARELSRVTGLDALNPAQVNLGYAGYVNVNPVTDSVTFFWYFPPQNGALNAPLLIWMNGGPGATSLYGCMEENGPFSISADGTTIIPRKFTWNEEFAMLFIDNPPGTGFSHTASVYGFAQNQSMVADDLYAFLSVFYRVYPDLLKVDLYITGESYAGKYVPSISHRIIEMNSITPPPATIMPFRGMSIGDGLMDPITQIPGYGDLLYNLGLASPQQRDFWHAAELAIYLDLLQGKNVDAFFIFDILLNGDFWQYNTFFLNTTGLTDYFNFRQPVYPPNGWQTWINRQDVRRAIHVGNQTFWAYNKTVEYYLINDWFGSVATDVAAIASLNYKVLVYNGQNDIILSAPQCQNFLNVMPWNGLTSWRNTSRVIWNADGDDSGPSGYAQSVFNFTYVVVRDAGHLLPQDQPLRAKDMITRFVRSQPFAPPPMNDAVQSAESAIAQYTTYAKTATN